MYNIIDNKVGNKILYFLGEESLMEYSPHSTSARAADETVVFMIDTAFFSQYGAIAVKVLSHVAKVISRRLRQTATRVVNTAAQYESGIGQVDDAQSGLAQAGRAPHRNALVVRPAVNDRVIAGAQPRRVDGRVTGEVEDAGDAAHSVSRWGPGVRVQQCVDRVCRDLFHAQILVAIVPQTPVSSVR